jgi:phosphopantetheine--protein transferase-like protein
MSTGTAIRVGTDVTAVHQVAESVRRFGVRYLERIYTEHEISSCVGEPLVEAASLAARFAAKEATIKVLRPVGHQPDWRSVEVRRDAGGWHHRPGRQPHSRRGRGRGRGRRSVSLRR